MVQEGFRVWKEFHDRFGQEQKQIQRQEPGLATWDHLAYFLEQHAGATRLMDYHRARFSHIDESVNDDVTVLRLSDGKAYVCGDYGEALIYGPDDSTTPKCGLNLKHVAEALRKAAFPDAATGAGYLRWPGGFAPPQEVATLPFGAMILLRQTVRMDKKGGWIEQSNALHCLVGGEGEFLQLEKQSKKRLIEGMLNGVIRKSAENLPVLKESIQRSEAQWIERLRRPSDAELESQIRHSVMPLFAAIITA